MKKFKLPSLRRRSRPNQFLFILSSLLLAFGLMVALYSIYSPKQTKAAWFNDGWAYRKPITVTNTTSSALTNLQYLATVSTSSEISAGKMQSDCDDVRFTNINGDILDYYYVSGCNGASTKYWILLDNIPASSNTAIIYMYYGNPSVTTASDPNKFDNVVNIVDYWRMNESSWTNNCSTGTVLDLNVNSLNGRSCPNSTGLTTPSAGKYGNAPSFNGSSQYFSVADNAAFDFTTQLTVEAWVNMSAVGTGYKGIVSRWATGVSDSSFLLYKSGNAESNQWQFLISNGSGLVVAQGGAAATGWTHLVGTYDGSYVKIYVNGKLAAQSAGAITIQNTALDLEIGRFNASNYFDGLIDDVKIYSSARTADQVFADYNASGNTYQLAVSTSTLPTISVGSEEIGQNGPRFYLNMDDGTGTTMQDNTQTNLDGTISNLPSGGTSATGGWQTEDQCISGKCFRFDGSTSTINVDVPDSFVPTAYTIAGWVKATDTTSVGIFLRTNSACNSGGPTGAWSHEIRITSGSKFEAYTYDGGSKSVVGTTTVEANKWYYVVATAQNSGQMKLYVNGKEEGTPANIGTLWTSGLRYCLGTNDGDGFGWFQGTLDEFKFYPYARSQAQVLADYNSRGSVSGVSIQNSQNPGNNPDTLNQGLVGYWKMDEASWNGTTGEAKDSSGNGNNGTAGNSATTGVGKFGKAGVLGSNKYLSVTDSTTIDPANTVTVSTWVKGSAQNQPNIGIVSKRYHASNDPYNSYGIGTQNSFNPPFTFCISNNAQSGTLTCATSTTNINTSSWQHVVGTYDGSNIKIYVNGILEGTTAAANYTLTYSNLPLTIGCYSTNNQCWSGSIDESRIYNRSLSPSEVTDLYNFGPQPVGYWRFDEGAGSTANDSSGYSNNASISSGSYANGKYGKALSKNGSGAGASFTYSAGSLLDFAASSNLSIGFWLKSSTSHTARIMEAPTNGGMGLEYAGTTLSLIAFSGNSSTFSNAISFDGNWHHYFVTYDGTTARFYKDGVLTTSNSYTGNWSTGSKTFYLGGDASFPLNGVLDDARIYNYALSSGQVTQVLNAGHPAPGSPLGSPIGYWKFNEGYSTTAYNSGNTSGINGTLTNMSSPATSTSGWTNSGKFGKSLNFDGSNDYVSIPTSVSLDPGSGNFTATIWLNTSTTGDQMLLSRYNSTNPYAGWGVAMNYATGSCGAGKVCFWDGSSWQGVTHGMSTSTWYHLAVVKNGTTVTFYVNGLSIGSITAQSSIGAATSSFLIGADTPLTSTLYYTGNMDEVKYFNSALTPQQVVLDMNQGQTSVQGALSDNTNYQPQAASQEYCVPGDSTSCISPITRWNFEEGNGSSANDSTGNANTCTLTNSPTWTPGKIGKALTYVSSSSQYLNCGNISSLNSANKFTITGWAKRSSTSSNYVELISKVTDANNYLAIELYNDGKLYLTIANGSVTYGDAGTLNDTNWHYIALVYDGTQTGNANRLKGYVDGVEKTLTFTGTIPSSTPNLSGNVEIGRVNIGGGFYSSGLIDQMMIFNYPLTQAQISWNYNQGLPRVYYKFDECQGTVINDASGNNFTGTITIGASGTQTTTGNCTTSNSAAAWYNGRTGKYNSSLNYDGTDDYDTITGTNFPSLGLNFTVSAWIYVNSFSSNRAILGQSNTASAFHLRTTTSGALESYIPGTVVSTTTNTSNTMSTNTWYHVVATKGASGSTTKLYINGVDLTSANGAPTTDYTATTADKQIGQRGNSSEYFAGQIDELQVFNYQLTPTQVKALYNQSAAVRFGPTSGAP